MEQRRAMDEARSFQEGHHRIDPSPEIGHTAPDSGSALLWHRPGFIKQLPNRYLQGFGDLVNDEHRRVANAPFDAADISPMQSAVVGKALLREALLLPQFL